MSRPKVVPVQISKFNRFVRHGLDEREARIADMIRHGFSNKEIAGELKMSEGGVTATSQQAVRKLGLRKRKELVWLWRNGEN